MEVDHKLGGLTACIQRILDLIAEGRRSLADADASEWKALALMRWEMLRALEELTAYKKRCILDPIMQSGEPRLCQRAQAIVIDNDELKTSYDDFVKHWSLNNPIATDAPYREAAIKMGRQIERQVIGDAQTIKSLLRWAPGTDEH